MPQLCAQQSLNRYTTWHCSALVARALCVRPSPRALSLYWHYALHLFTRYAMWRCSALVARAPCARPSPRALGWHYALHQFCSVPRSLALLALRLLARPSLGTTYIAWFLLFSFHILFLRLRRSRVIRGDRVHQKIHSLRIRVDIKVHGRRQWETTAAFFLV